MQYNPSRIYPVVCSPRTKRMLKHFGRVQTRSRAAEHVLCSAWRLVGKVSSQIQIQMVIVWVKYSYVNDSIIIIINIISYFSINIEITYSSHEFLRP